MKAYALMLVDGGYVWFTRPTIIDPEGSECSLHAEMPFTKVMVLFSNGEPALGAWIGDDDYESALSRLAEESLATESDRFELVEPGVYILDYGPTLQLEAVVFQVDVNGVVYPYVEES